MSNNTSGSIRLASLVIMILVVAAALEIWSDISFLRMLPTEGNKMRDAVSAQLRDPSSVKFRNVYKSEVFPDVWCGEVNGKNLYGAYVGFRRFRAEKEDNGSYEIRIADPNRFAGADDDVREPFQELDRLLVEAGCEQ